MQTTLLESAALPECTFKEQKFPILIFSNKEIFDKARINFERSIFPKLKNILEKYNQLKLDDQFDTSIFWDILKGGKLVIQEIEKKVDNLSELLGHDLAKQSHRNLSKIMNEIILIKNNLIDNYNRFLSLNEQKFGLNQIHYLNNEFFFCDDILDDIFETKFCHFIKNENELEIYNEMDSFRKSYNSFISLCKKNNYPAHLMKVDHTFLMNFFNPGTDGILLENETACSFLANIKK